MSSGHYLNTQMPSINIVNGFNLGNNNPVTLKVNAFQVIGQGTFGSIEKANVSVMKVTERENGDNSSNTEKFVGAIKKVHQDPRYKNRELTIIQKIRKHPNIVDFRYYYYSIMNNSNKSRGDGLNGQKRGLLLGTNATSNNVCGHINTNGGGSNNVATNNNTTSSGNSSNSSGDIYLHLVMECMPECLSDLIVRYHRRNLSLSSTNIRVYTHQMLRALGYLHALGICHRDIKTSNMLVDEVRHTVKLCDFGSAKELVSGANSVSYISSRYYRAPELLFGAQQYTTAIDVWSAGCVLGEMLRMGCLFTGSDTVDQIVKIVRILGSPTPADYQAMNPTGNGSTSGSSGVNISAAGLPQVLPCPVRLFFPHSAPSDLLDLLSKMLVYDPTKRPHPLRLLLHKSFDVLYTPPAATNTNIATTTTTSNNAPVKPQQPSKPVVPLSLEDFLTEELNVLTLSEQNALLSRQSNINNSATSTTTSSNTTNTTTNPANNTTMSA